MLRTVVDLLFPRTCAGCGARAWPFCPACWARVAVLLPPGCLRCGRPLHDWAPGCPDCPPGPITWARAAFHYDGPVRAAVMRLKFGRLRSVADALAPWMLAAVARGPPFEPTGHAFEPTPLTWVPLGRRRLRARGFDQAEALARSLGRLTGWPVVGLLRRGVETPEQARRGVVERQRALRGAFRAVDFPPRRILLVDDVLTSGFTAGECARVLVAAGAREVGVVTAARALGGALPARCYNPPGLQPGSVVAREMFSR